MNRYTRTDLAAELDLGDRHDVSETTERFGEVKASTIEIRTEGAAKRLGKPRGKYITIDVGKIWLASDPDFEKAVDVTADKLAQLSCELCGHLPERVLIAGLGKPQHNSRRARRQDSRAPDRHSAHQAAFKGAVRDVRRL